MIDPAAAAHKAKQLLEASTTFGGKPVLLVGGDDDRRLTMQALADSCGATSTNLNEELAQALIAAADPRLDIATVIATYDQSSQVLLLDRISILMLPQLRTNAIDVLCRVARRRPVCASWPGRLDHARLRYADPDHPEWLDEDASRALVLDLMTNEGTNP